MHELGIVFHIIKSVKDVAISNNVKHINKVVLEVGEVSTVIPHYLDDCWKWAVNQEDIMKDCILEIKILPAITICESCNKTFSTIKYKKICPYCLSDNTHLLSGNEVNIKEIEVE